MICCKFQMEMLKNKRIFVKNKHKNKGCCFIFIVESCPHSLRCFLCESDHSLLQCYFYALQRIIILKTNQHELQLFFIYTQTDCKIALVAGVI